MWYMYVPARVQVCMRDRRNNPKIEIIPSDTYNKRVMVTEL